MLPENGDILFDRILFAIVNVLQESSHSAFDRIFEQFAVITIPPNLHVGGMGIM